jgi:hypothetical protein
MVGNHWVKYIPLHGNGLQRIQAAIEELLGMSLPTISFFYFIIVFLQSTQDT